MTHRLAPVFAAMSLFVLSACDDAYDRYLFMCDRSESEFMQKHGTKRVVVGSHTELDLLTIATLGFPMPVLKKDYASVPLNATEASALLVKRAKICELAHP